MLRRFLVCLAIGLFGATLASADIQCPEWKRLNEAQRSASLDAMIQGHIFSDKGKRYTSENKMAMKRCLEAFRSQLLDEFHDTCADARTAGKDAIDDVFDKYLLSCVQ